MKRVVIADDQGFCWGVRRALEIVDQHGDVLILGDLIHNKQVVQQLEERGKKIVHAVTGEEKKPVVITAHGTIIGNYLHLEKLGMEVVDTTCPLVSAIYKAGENLENEGYRILVIGNKEHVEVKGIASRLNNPIIVNNEEELARVTLPDRLGVTCQSTYSVQKFDKLVSQIRTRTTDVKVKNTTCSPTKKRQSAAEQLAKQVELMIVVGGYHSSNTKKLAELTSQFVESYHIETSAQLNPEWFEGKSEIGITSGASTADWIVEEIRQKIESFD